MYLFANIFIHKFHLVSSFSSVMTVTQGNNFVFYVGKDKLLLIAEARLWFMKGQSRVVGLACKPLKAWFSEIRGRESTAGFSLWFSVSSVLLLYCLLHTL